MDDSNKKGTVTFTCTLDDIHYYDDGHGRGFGSAGVENDHVRGANDFSRGGFRGRGGFSGRGGGFSSHTESVYRSSDPAAKPTKVFLMGQEWSACCLQTSTKLKFYLTCDESKLSNTWWADVKIKFVVGKNRILKTIEMNQRFNHSTNNFKGFFFTLYDTQTYKENGVLNVKLDLEIIKANFEKLDLTAPNTQSNVVLLAEGKKLHVNKEYLAIHSRFFNALFFLDFSEKNNDEISLKDVSYENLKAFMEALYPQGKSINASNFEVLLELADRYEARQLFENIERFLIETKDVTMVKKLEVTDKFDLAELLNSVLDSFVHSTSLIKFMKGDGAGLGRGVAMSALFQKYIDLLDLF